ncbi:hypothetical protein [Desulfosporosinus burensis]
MIFLSADYFIYFQDTFISIATINDYYCAGIAFAQAAFSLGTLHGEGAKIPPKSRCSALANEFLA